MVQENQTEEGLCRKLQDKYSGPYKVIRVFDNNRVELDTDWTRRTSKITTHRLFPFRHRKEEQEWCTGRRKGKNSTARDGDPVQTHTEADPDIQDISFDIGKELRVTENIQERDPNESYGRERRKVKAPDRLIESMHAGVSFGNDPGNVLLFVPPESHCRQTTTGSHHHAGQVPT